MHVTCFCSLSCIKGIYFTGDASNALKSPSPGLLGGASDAHHPRGIPRPPLASARVAKGDGQDLGPDAATGLSRTPGTSPRAGGALVTGGLAGDAAYWGFTQAFHVASPLPGSEHEDERGHSSTSGLSKWLQLLGENPRFFLLFLFLALPCLLSLRVWVQP